MSGRVDSTSPTTLDRGSMTRTRNGEWVGDCARIYYSSVPCDILHICNDI